LGSIQQALILYVEDKSEIKNIARETGIDEMNLINLLNRAKELSSWHE
jgi:hypothetical protein